MKFGVIDSVYPGPRESADGETTDTRQPMLRRMSAATPSLDLGCTSRYAAGAAYHPAPGAKSQLRRELNTLNKILHKFEDFRKISPGNFMKFSQDSLKILQ